VELDVVEQRCRAVLEVLEGATVADVADVAKRDGVARQTDMTDCTATPTTAAWAALTGAGRITLF
jgi:hypothetical protein